MQVNGKQKAGRTAAAKGAQATGRTASGLASRSGGAPDGASDDALQLETWLPYRLFRISVRVADLLGAFYGPKYGMSRAAWRTMAIAANRPGISVKEICQASGLDQFTVSRAIRQLVELGFAQRQAGQSDRRYAAIELSQDGWTVFGEISDLSRLIDAELMASISDEEMRVLDTVLDKLDNASAGVLARGWHNLKDAQARKDERD